MKRNSIYLLLMLVLGLTGTVQAKHHFQTSASVGFFYSSLSRYGEWIESDYGNAWRPLHVDYGWRPYLIGRWAWTDYGWYWVSNEPFGWATFHYGRWHYDDYYGWIWIPDYNWGPAWVEWCYNDDYIGWAPLSPYATFNINIGITITDNWITPVHYWNFIPGRYFTTTRVVDYIQPIDHNRRIYGRVRNGEMIRYKDDRVINRGIDINFVERRTNTRINRVDVVNRDRGEGERFVRESGRERIEVYRPRLEELQNRDRTRRIDVQRNNDRSRVIERSGRDTRSIDPNTIRERRNQREQVTSDRKIESTRQPKHDFDREQQLRDMRQRQEQQREQIQRRQDDQRMREQQTRENRNREIPRIERTQPQVRERRQERERPQQFQRPPESRRNEERKRKP